MLLVVPDIRLAPLMLALFLSEEVFGVVLDKVRMQLRIICSFFLPLGLQLMINFVRSVHNLLMIFHGALIKVLTSVVVNRRMLLLRCLLSIDRRMSIILDLRCAIHRLLSHTYVFIPSHIIRLLFLTVICVLWRFITVLGT